jgi:hypothetical protein
MVQQKPRKPVKTFAACIERAQQHLDEANTSLSRAFDTTGSSEALIKTFTHKLLAIEEDIALAQVCIGCIIDKLSARDLPVTTNKVQEIDNHVRNVSSCCQLLLRSLHGGDLNDQQLKLLTDLKTGMQYLSSYGREFMLKSVYTKLCKEKKR